MLYRDPLIPPSIQFLDRFLPADTLLLYLDEKGPYRAKRYGGRYWNQNRLQIDIRQPVHGKIHLLGAL